MMKHTGTARAVSALSITMLLGVGGCVGEGADSLATATAPGKSAGGLAAETKGTASVGAPVGGADQPASERTQSLNHDDSCVTSKPEEQCSHHHALSDAVAALISETETIAHFFELHAPSSGEVATSR
jgi:hypothetical protein